MNQPVTRAEPGAPAESDAAAGVGGLEQAENLSEKELDGVAGGIDPLPNWLNWDA